MDRIGDGRDLAARTGWPSELHLRRIWRTQIEVVSARLREHGVSNDLLRRRGREPRVASSSQLRPGLAAGPSSGRRTIPEARPSRHRRQQTEFQSPRRANHVRPEEHSHGRPSVCRAVAGDRASTTSLRRRYRSSRAPAHPPCAMVAASRQRQRGAVSVLSQGARFVLVSQTSAGR